MNFLNMKGRKNVPLAPLASIKACPIYLRRMEYPFWALVLFHCTRSNLPASMWDSSFAFTAFALRYSFNAVDTMLVI